MLHVFAVAFILGVFPPTLNGKDIVSLFWWLFTLLLSDFRPTTVLFFLPGPPETLQSARYSMITFLAVQHSLSPRGDVMQLRHSFYGDLIPSLIVPFAPFSSTLSSRESVEQRPFLLLPPGCFFLEKSLTSCCVFLPSSFLPFFAVMMGIGMAVMIFSIFSR